VLTQRFDQLEEKIERAYKYRDKQSVQQARESNLKPIPNALPGAHDVFDRTNECAKLFDLLIAEDTRLVRILAPSGYGKTKLVAKFLQQTARQINQETGQSPVDGILYVECQAGASIVWGQIVERTGLMFGRREELRDEISRIQSPPQQAAYLLDELEAAGRFWLVFDNFESLLDAENAMVGADESDPIRNLFHLVCSEADNQRLVVTTRREPVFKGKNAPLLQNRFLLEVGGTPETDAINYLRTEGKDYLLDQLDQIDKTVLRDFVRRVDCLPLAVISLLRDLKSYFDSKPTGKVTLDDVAAIVAAGTRYVEADKENGLRLWLTDQIKQLHPDEKDLLCALSAFNKPCPAIALEFVLPDFSAGKIEKLLARLERDRLLYQEGDGFQLSVIIRDAAYSLIPAEVSAMEDNQSAKGQRDFNRNTLHSRSADFYRTQRKPQEQWKTIADLQPQLDEIYQRIQAGEFETAAEVLQGIDFKYLLLWSNYRLIIELREQLEVRLPENGFLALAQANILGLAYRNTGRIRESIKQFEKAIQIAKLINNQQGEGASLGNLGNAYYNLGDYRKAIEYHEQHLNISREIGNRLGEGQSLGNLGSAYYSLGYYRKAIEYHEQSLQIKREIGDRFGEGNSLGNLGNAYYSLGYYRKAIEYHEQALEIDREIGNRLGEGQSLGNLGNAYHSLGETEKACGLWREALIIFEAIESPYANNARQWLEKNCRS
ncbi:MAG TPA: tetratricopeptide repeat protein, partial [Pyrinomonadaceae bacterium]